MNTIERMYNMVLLVKFIYSLIMLILIISLKMLISVCWVKFRKYLNFSHWDYFICDLLYNKCRISVKLLVCISLHVYVDSLFNMMFLTEFQSWWKRIHIIWSWFRYLCHSVNEICQNWIFDVITALALINKYTLRMVKRVLKKWKCLKRYG